MYDCHKHICMTFMIYWEKPKHKLIVDCQNLATTVDHHSQLLPGPNLIVLPRAFLAVSFWLRTCQRIKSVCTSARELCRIGHVFLTNVTEDELTPKDFLVAHLIRGGRLAFFVVRGESLWRQLPWNSRSQPFFQYCEL